MRPTLLAVLLAMPLAANAGGALDRLNSWARQAGVPPIVAPPAQPPKLERELLVTGEGQVSG